MPSPCLGLCDLAPASLVTSAGDAGARSTIAPADAASVLARLESPGATTHGRSTSTRPPVPLPLIVGAALVVAGLLVAAAAGVLALAPEPRTMLVEAAADGAARVDPVRPAAIVEALGGGVAGDPLVIDVAGGVARPGIVRVPMGSRVGDAIRLAGGATLWLVWTERYGPARGTGAAAVGAVTVGWVLAQDPYVLPPRLTLDQAAASDATLASLLIGVAIGALFLVPSLWYLYRLVLQGRLDQEFEPLHQRFMPIPADDERGAQP